MTSGGRLMKTDWLLDCRHHERSGGPAKGLWDGSHELVEDGTVSGPSTMKPGLIR